MAINLKKVVEQLESCGYTCEAGPLENNADFMKLQMAAGSSEEWEEAEPVELDDDLLLAHIEDRLKEMAYTPDRDFIELILDLHYEHLNNIGIVDIEDE